MIKMVDPYFPPFPIPTDRKDKLAKLFFSFWWRCIRRPLCRALEHRSAGQAGSIIITMDALKDPSPKPGEHDEASISNKGTDSMLEHVQKVQYTLHIKYQKRSKTTKGQPRQYSKLLGD